MLQTILRLMLGVILLSTALACAPGQPTPGPNDINTAIAQTLDAAATQTSGPGIPVTGDESPTATQTPSPEVPTVTVTQLPSATMTAIPLFTPTPSVTFAPGTVQISVSVPTNCRVGPGRGYTRVGALLVGESVEVVGRNTAGNYWIIRNPDDPDEFCWLWGEFATVTGNTTVLPVFTPPPRPTPAAGFDPSLGNVESCPATGTWWVDIVLENTGGITFRSFFLSVTDTVTDSHLTLYRNDFIDRHGCNTEEDLGDLDPGDTLIASSPNLNYNPTGHRMSARITVCSNLNQSGTCLTKRFDFTP